MNLSVQRNRQAGLLTDASARKATKHLLGAITLAVTASVPAGDVRDIELRRLFDPTQAEVASEAEGRIYIYDGLTDVDVQRALNEQFQRVENMMFIRTRKTDKAGEVKRDAETGEVDYEDDGC
ncbi:MAG: hypothetical protein PVJ30_04920 [Thiohalocapsa sp.]|jgi:hypothetical protein